jgi:hypothetical protein
MSSNMPAPPAPAMPQTEEEKRMAEMLRIHELEMQSAREALKIELRDEFVRSRPLEEEA